MLILHAAFEEDNIYLWGERSVSEGEKAERKKAPAPLPHGAKSADLDAALKSLFPHKGRGATEHGKTGACVIFPSRGGTPLPSSPILGEVESDGEPELTLYRVEAIKISFPEFIQFLHMVQETEERLPVPGLIFADDLKYMCGALEYACSLVRRGCFMPDMDARGASYVSQWRPLILAKDQEEFSSFASAVPPILRTFCINAEERGREELEAKEDCAFLLLETMIDMLIRASQQGSPDSKGKKVNSGNPHEIWLRSLIWPKAPLSQWDEEMSLLYPQIREWADALKAVTAQPWRLSMRLEEPVSDAGLWILSWQLQSTQDPGLIIPAERVWSPTETERAWFEHTRTNPRRYMLQILGHLASTVPYIARSLDAPSPSECRLALDEVFDFLQNHLTSILEQGIQVHFPANWGDVAHRPRLSARAVVKDGESFSVSGGMSMSEMLDVDWSVALGDDILTAEEFAMLTELKTPLVNLRGRWVIIDREDVEKLTKALRRLPDKISRRDALLSSLRQEFEDAPVSAVSGSKWLEGVKSLLSGAKPLEEAQAPEGFSGSLRPYQAKGLDWLSRLSRLGLGACLADDMGLGKTVQTLALIKRLRDGGERRPVLLVCPTSVMENWRREAERFVPGMKTFIHHGMKRNKERFTAGLEDTLVISSYSLIHRDRTLFAETDWAGEILDEAQNIKNPDALQSRAARSINASWRVALTGTPVENHVGDLWSIMDFLIPGLMPNRSRFTREILRPIQSGDQNAMEQVRGMTSPFILRRLKTDKEIISDLPEKIESNDYCLLTREQATLYSSVTEYLKREVRVTEGIKRKGLVLGAITALKEICDHPLLYLKDKSEIGARSGKMARLLELCEEMLASRDRALIFTQYAEMGGLLKSFLQETFGREVLFLHGAVPREKRSEMVRRFQEEKDGPPFFVLSLKAGGTGLNLTGANHVIMFDRWWNPAVEQQAVDRAYRIGQRRNVQVHYFCCRGTLEEKIEALIASKKEVAETVIKSGEGWITEMNDGDLYRLFKLESGAVDIS